MPDNETRLMEGRHALHSLELQIEQHRIHISELSAHADEARRARAVLERLIADLALQRTYCGLLSRAGQAEELSVKNGSRVA